MYGMMSQSAGLNQDTGITGASHEWGKGEGQLDIKGAGLMPVDFLMGHVYYLTFILAFI